MKLDKDFILKKYKEGLSCREISEILNCKPLAVYYFMRKNNIPTRNRSECKIGDKNPFYNKKHSNETKEKISKTHKGCMLSLEHKKKIGDSSRGIKRPQHSIEMSGVNNPMYGKPSPALGKFGAEAPNWQGGRSNLQKIIRSSFKYEEWRNFVFKRDNFTCQKCGDNRGGNFNVDHIKPFSVILKENKILSLQNALDCNELWDVNNGRVLCVPCHKSTDTYGNKKS